MNAPLERDPGESRDAALIVAIENYAYLPDVPGASDNGELWRDYFVQVRGIPDERVAFLSNDAALHDTIIEATRKAAMSVRPGGKLWFIFIGHGAHDARGDGLLVGVDAQQIPERLAHRSVPQSHLLREVRKTRGLPVVIIDACFSGKNRSGAPLVPGVQPSVVVVKSAHAKGVVMFTAAASDQFAGAFPTVERPAFSYLMLGALRGWADQDRNGRVTAREIIDYTRSALSQILQFERSQTPELHGPNDLELSRAQEPSPSLEDICGRRPGDLIDVSFSDCSSPHFGRYFAPLVPPVSRIDSRPRDTRPEWIEAEILFGKANDAQVFGEQTPTEPIKAWCHLARIKKNNPYLLEAESMCRRWQEFGREISHLKRDYLCVKRFMNSAIQRSKEEHQNMLNLFWLRYGALHWHPDIRAIQQRAPVYVREAFIRWNTGAGRESNGFYLDVTEVTIEAYTRCQELGGCTPRFSSHDFCAPDAQRNYERSPKQPAACVTWRQALEYCEWVGKRLPTSDEWTRAAQGMNGNLFPWGNEPVGCGRAVISEVGAKFGCGLASAWDVGSKPAGTSDEGVYDLVGNVEEWTQSRTTRGGSFVSDVVSDSSLSVARAIKRDEQEPRPFIGFRCARNAMSD